MLEPNDAERGREALAFFPGLSGLSGLSGSPGSRRVSILKGRPTITAAQPMMQRLAARCGQAGEADYLASSLTTPGGRKKNAWLVLVAGPGRASTAALDGDSAGDDLLGAVLLFEYKTILGGSRVLSTLDPCGRRGVLAPAGERARVAAAAMRALMDEGAQIVHMAFNEEHRDEQSPQKGTGVWAEQASAWAIAEELAAHRASGNGTAGKRAAAAGAGWASWALGSQTIAAYLPLETTYDRTLARIGQRTRSNLRYYRRRSEADLGCHFIESVSIGLEEFLEQNRRSTFAVTEPLARDRYESLGPGWFLCGIRDREGCWLSLAGGRHQNSVVELHWQMNRADRPQYSLSTVMRSYLIEREIARGTRRLYIEGGTPHPIERSFVRERIGELTGKRRSIYVRLLERFASRILPANNYLGQVLTDSRLRWRSW